MSGRGREADLGSVLSGRRANLVVKDGVLYEPDALHESMGIARRSQQLRPRARLQVTRNAKDYKGAPVARRSAGEVLALLQAAIESSPER